MGQPYIGEIRMFAGNFAPVNWAFCNGQTISISDNETLFTLIGTTYGGDGQTTFNLPNLSGRAPMHAGNGPFNLQVGQQGGTENVTLTSNQLALHSHPLIASGGAGNSNVATAAAQLSTMGPPSTTSTFLYAPGSGTNQVGLNGSSISPVGGGGSHSNIQPTVAINFIISLFGIFPSPQ